MVVPPPSSFWLMLLSPPTLLGGGVFPSSHLVGGAAFSSSIFRCCCLPRPRFVWCCFLPSSFLVLLFFLLSLFRRVRQNLQETQPLCRARAPCGLSAEYLYPSDQPVAKAATLKRMARVFISFSFHFHFFLSCEWSCVLPFSHVPFFIFICFSMFPIFTFFRVC